MANPLQTLRDRMAEYHIDAYLIPTADFHGSEYVGDHFACGGMSPASPAPRAPAGLSHWRAVDRWALLPPGRGPAPGVRHPPDENGPAGVPTIEGFLRSSLQRPDLGV